VARTVDRLGDVTRAFEVDAADATSAWVAGVAAARRHGVVLLTHDGALAPESATWLKHHKEVKQVPVGGSDPAAVAVSIAQRFFHSPSRAALVSTGPVIAGLTSAARLAVHRGPLLYASGSTLSAGTSSYLADVRATLSRVDLIGSGLPYDDVEADTQAALLG
jgi:hypothetical protein